MALARRGSRRITVDGTVYRWRTRRRPTYGQGLGWSSMTFAVEHAASPGQALVVETGHPRPDNWLGLGPIVPVTPHVVAAAVRRALHEGWSPRATGSPHHMTLTGARSDYQRPPPGTAEDGGDESGGTH